MGANISSKEEILGKIINNGPVIAFLWKAENTPDEKWPVEYVSDNICLFGYTVEDFISGSLLYADIIHPDDLPEVETELAEISRAGGTVFVKEYRIRTKYGEDRWVKEQTFIQRNDEGIVTHYQGTIFDITEQKNREMALEESLKAQRSLENAINNSSTMVFLWRAEEFLPTDYASENVSKLGYSAEDFVLGRISYSDLIHPDDYEIVKDTLAEKCEDDSDNYTQEYRVISKDGKTLWVSQGTFIQRAKDGNATHLQGIVQDITEQKEEEIALKAALEKQAELLDRKKALETIVNHSPVVAFLWKAGSDDEMELWPVEFVSDNITNFGYSVDDFLSGEVLYGNIISPEDLLDVQTELSDISREGGTVFVKEYRIKTKSGEQRWVEEQTFIQRNDEGVVTHYLGVIQDITERKEK
ncbi:MAG: putative diguanylate cyclase [Methanomethylovorans sp. PtaU1.Bin093]|uniref:PAS domain-containing protein n=1 Tax=Methanomethylovorans sp. PtaU1.Bin093 TaxID=1811679 RepID=UPI0009D1B0FF|nr:PAS domain-containing protein [Methanomethylovorans sp. PtaU1.Bin093]OPY19647.1 MAG: putative diguanylate cyclase [Methanomethylovorans sp. PtaU1.Bin093]